MSYLAKLKEFEGESVSCSQEIELSKPTKPPFGSFDSTPPRDNVKKINCITQDETECTQEEKHIEARRQKVLALLQSNPETQRVVIADSDSDPANVILTIAVRSVATFELLVEKARFDPLQLLELIDTHSMNTH